MMNKLSHHVQSSATEFLIRLGSVEQLQERASQQSQVLTRPLFNTHIHFPPNFSAFKSIQQAISMALKEDVKVLGAGNYYDYSVYREFSTVAVQNGIFPLFSTEVIALEKDLQGRGVRVNDPDNPGKYYMCGKAITRFENKSKRAEELLGTIRKNDAKRMQKMVELMAKRFVDCGIQTNLDNQAVIETVVSRHHCDRKAVVLQERHAARAFQEILFEKIPAGNRIEKASEIFGRPLKSDPENAVAVQNEIRSVLMKAGKPCFAPETFISLEQARELILELGGIPCHPVLSDWVSPPCEYETPLEKLIEKLQDNRWSMAEFISVRNSPGALAEAVRTIRNAGIACVVGTEHNTLDLIPIAPTCKKGIPIPHEILDIFWEGTCVMVAHQFLGAHKQSGFVDHQGCPNNSYKTDHERIKAFARLGQAVLSKFIQR